MIKGIERSNVFEDESLLKIKARLKNIMELGGKIRGTKNRDP